VADATSPALMWFRQDLRLRDNPALSAAVSSGQPVVPVFILDDAGHGSWAAGAARRWWLHHSLAALDDTLGDIGSRLILRQGDGATVLDELIKQTGADAVYWNRRYEPAVIERDKQIKRDLADRGIDAQSFNGHLIWEPWDVETKGGSPYKVYTPYWRNVQQRPDRGKPRDAPDKLKSPKAWPRSDSLKDLGLLPSLDWDEPIAACWTPGEQGAQDALDRFVRGAVGAYDDERNRPDHEGTSCLSPHLHHGEISPRDIWHRVTVKIHRKQKNEKAFRDNAWTFLSEIAWREFAYHLLFHFPHTTDEPLYEKYADFPWIDMRQGRHWLEAWQAGRTGYPIVDAGMRQLWLEGWMHNRVRMVVASFLVKDLLISWTHGARWFWDTLVDADLASNTLGWQWAAGCGADAAPYFRIFNPVRQGERFDPQGDYVRHYVPELKDMPSKFIHKPWEAPSKVLADAGVELTAKARDVKYAHEQTPGQYPTPIVEHSEARDRALEALETIKS